MLPKKAPPKKQVNVRLDLETRRRLKRLAREGNKTQTDVLTDLISKAAGE